MRAADPHHPRRDHSVSDQCTRRRSGDFALTGAPTKVAPTGAPQKISLSDAPMRITPKVNALPRVPTKFALAGTPKAVAPEGVPKSTAFAGAPRVVKRPACRRTSRSGPRRSDCARSNSAVNLSRAGASRGKQGTDDFIHIHPNSLRL